MGVSRKQSTPNFPKNEHFLPPDTHTYVCVTGAKKCLFFGKFGELCFLKTPIMRFAFLPYYRRSDSIIFLLLTEIADKTGLTNSTFNFNPSFSLNSAICEIESTNVFEHLWLNILNHLWEKQPTRSSCWWYT